MSKAFIPLSGPMLIVRLNKPRPEGIHITQVPYVVKVPLPDRVPVSVILSISALIGNDNNANSAISGRRNRIIHFAWDEV
jgi:hypothetical protein